MLEDKEDVLQEADSLHFKSTNHMAARIKVTEVMWVISPPTYWVRGGDSRVLFKPISIS